MIPKKDHHYIYIIYDGLSNPVFYSQVLSPLLNQIKQYPEYYYHIISFEKNIITQTPNNNGITYTLFKRYPYLGKWSLWTAIKKIHLYVLQYTSYTIVARGPFAGFVAIHAQTKNCKEIIIQARGLAGQEYAYIHQKYYTLIHRIRSKLLHKLEYTVYSIQDEKINIQAITPALKEYLIKHFNANPSIITIANHDIPATIDLKQKLMYRTAIRNLLHIKYNTTVYCYSGSYKIWQCPEETIQFFLNKLANNHNSYLLILTPDQDIFKIYLDLLQVPVNRYHICCVNFNEIYHYLSAADYGIIFREKHIINYVSRPTKVLEYHAAGLQIIHNKTVDYINHICNKTISYNIF